MNPNSPAPAQRRRAAFKTLGCKLNQSESDSIAAGLQSLGWEIAEFGEQVDAVVVNGCTITNAADRKSRNAVNRALRLLLHRTGLGQAAGSLVVVTGCGSSEYWNRIDGSTYVVGNDYKSHIPHLLDKHFRGEVFSNPRHENPDLFSYPLPGPLFHTRVMIKIQDGCDNHCTFCIIPSTRGRAQSRPLPDVVDAMEEAVAAGYKEIVLTGVNMARWTSDGADFSRLVEAALRVQGDFRLRLGSLEPDGIGKDFVDMMTHPKMVPHLHLCLQSGSDRILLAMRRQYTLAEFMDIVSRLRSQVPYFNLTTDIIVGFPGESEEDFDATLRVCSDVGFGHIHTFPYSRRHGTRADRMAHQVPASLKRKRARAIRELSEHSKRKYRESLVGSSLEVLTEQADPDESLGGFRLRGTSAHYVPVRFPLRESASTDNIRNRMFTVRIDGVDNGPDPDLYGRVCRGSRALKRQTAC